MHPSIHLSSIANINTSEERKTAIVGTFSAPLQQWIGGADRVSIRRQRLE
jgi:hypothetical protein